MTALLIQGDFIEIGDLEGIDQPGIIVHRAEGDLVIYGLTRAEVKSLAEHFLTTVMLKIEVES